MDIKELAIELFGIIRKSEKDGKSFIEIFEAFVKTKELSEQQSHELAKIILPMAVRRLKELEAERLLEEVRQESRERGFILIKGGANEKEKTE